MRIRSIVRNVLIIVGSYYVSFVVAVPVAAAGDFMMPGFAPMWLFLSFGAIAGGLLAGFTADGPRPLVWALVFGAFIVLATMSSFRWSLPARGLSLGGQLLAVLLPAGLGVVSFLFAHRRMAAARPEVKNVPAT